MSVVSPFQGLVLVILFAQGDAARLTPLRFALGWCVEAPSGQAPAGRPLQSPSADRCALTILSSAGQVLVVENPRAGSVVRDSGFVIRRLDSAIRNPKSAICNPHERGYDHGKKGHVTEQDRGESA